MRAFLDANILFSAARSNGAIRRLLALLQEKGHVCFADPFVVGEADRNLSAKYHDCLAGRSDLLRSVQVEPLITTRSLPESIVRRLPEKDQPVLAAAIELNCAVLVTGDRAHFGSFSGETVSGVAIHSSASLYEQLN